MHTPRKYPTWRRVIENIKGEGSLKAKILKGKYELELKSTEGLGESQTKQTLHGRGMIIVWNKINMEKQCVWHLLFI